MGSPRFQTLIFDLDDTLIPTSEALIPQAVRNVFQVLVRHGLPWTFESFETYRKKHIRDLPHREIIKKLILENSLETKKHILEESLNAFYSNSLPEKIPLLPGAQENLEKLSQKYGLFLLTAGDRATQKLKITKLGIEKFFRGIEIADEKWKFDKKAVLESWISAKQITPIGSLSIGNRLKDEIRASKALGIYTCHFKYGEHAGESPTDHLEITDYNVQQHSELILTCQL